MSRSAPLKIAFLASEVAPFAKTGGLADVAGALPGEMVRRGHDVRVFMPLYSSISTDEIELTPIDFLRGIEIRFGPHTVRFSVFVGRAPGSDVDVFFVNCPGLFHRQSIYTGEWDEHLRFALLTRAALESCQRMGWGPDIVHSNDWHTALAPIYLKTVYAWDREVFGKTKTVLTIHNIAYQGVYPADVLENLGLAEYARLLHQEDLRRGIVNYLKSGILYADVVSTVSETYAKEIQTEAFGNGLDRLLRNRSGTVVGIVNGVDYSTWDPSVDPHLVRKYDADSVVAGKRANRDHLLKETKLIGAGPRVPVLGVVSRFTAQKGFDLVGEALVEALRFLDVRLVALGSGEKRYEDLFTRLEHRFPGKAVHYRGYHEGLAHLIEAGADIFLMPSRFEPCGLNQMYSLRYGTPPIVRKTGGLADTVEPWDPRRRTGTGFVFEHFDERGFAWALKSALETWQDPEAWAVLRRNGMEQDFSWERQGAKYERLYRVLAA